MWNGINLHCCGCRNTCNILVCPSERINELHNITTLWMCIYSGALETRNALWIEYQIISDHPKPGSIIYNYQSWSGFTKLWLLDNWSQFRTSFARTNDVTQLLRSTISRRLINSGLTTDVKLRFKSTLVVDYRFFGYSRYYYIVCNAKLI